MGAGPSTTGITLGLEPQFPIHRLVPEPGTDLGPESSRPARTGGESLPGSPHRAKLCLHTFHGCPDVAPDPPPHQAPKSASQPAPLGAGTMPPSLLTKATLCKGARGQRGAGNLRPP